LLGYIVYLAVSFFSGELLENTLTIFLIYFPSYEDYLLEKLSMREKMKLRKSRQSNEIKRISQLTAGSGSLSNRVTHRTAGGSSHALFDDAETPPHIIGAEFTMSHTSHDYQQSESRHEHDHDSITADFTMGFRHPASEYT
jgi:hypothetical protein